MLSWLSFSPNLRMLCRSHSRTLSPDHGCTPRPPPRLRRWGILGRGLITGPRPGPLLGFCSGEYWAGGRQGGPFTGETIRLVTDKHPQGLVHWNWRPVDEFIPYPWISIFRFASVDQLMLRLISLLLSHGVHTGSGPVHRAPGTCEAGNACFSDSNIVRIFRVQSNCQRLRQCSCSFLKLEIAGFLMSSVSWIYSPVLLRM
jgi:hypothetical protein